MHVVYGLATRLGLVYTPFDDGEYSHPPGYMGSRENKISNLGPVLSVFLNAQRLYRLVLVYYLE